MEIQSVINRFQGESFLSISHLGVTSVGHAAVTCVIGYNFQSICHGQEVLDGTCLIDQSDFTLWL